MNNNNRLLCVILLGSIIFVRGIVFPERHTTSGRADTSRKELKDYQYQCPIG